MARSFLSLSNAEARAHAIILAAVLWIGAVVLVVSGHEGRDGLGGLLGQDFVHFYTLGAVVNAGTPELLFDPEGLHARQVALVPTSDPEFFLPVYGPQVALVFAPLARLPYAVAAVVWGLLTVFVYAGLVRAAWRTAPVPGADALFVAAAAAGFPPFWNLVLHGQTTAFALLGFGAAWIALARRRRFAAGLAFGALLLKPAFGLALAPVLVLRREWRIIAGIVAMAVVQVVAVSMLLGSAVWRDYIDVLLSVPAQRSALEPRPYQLHSIRAFTSVLPGVWATVAWIAASLFVVGAAVAVWRPGVPTRLRMAVLVVASVLVSPHLTIYDATVLALPLLWIAGELSVAPSAHQRSFWRAVYLLFVVYLIPFALLIRLQPSILVLTWILAISVAIARSSSAEPPSAAGAEQV